MNALLVSTVVALGIGQPAPSSADGKWVIVYAEEGGRRNNAWEQRLATCMDGTLSYEDTTGKKVSVAMKFGAHQHLDATVTETGAGQAWHGVFILGQDYLCLSLHKGARKTGGGKTSSGAGGAASGDGGAAPAQPAAAGGAPGSGADFIMILRRLRSGKAKSTQQ